MDGLIEKRLLAAILSNRRNFIALSEFLASTDFSEIGRLIYGQVQEYYEADPDTSSVDSPTFLSRIKRRYRGQAEIISEVAESCYALVDSISEINLLEEIFSQKQQIAEARLSDLLRTTGKSDNEVRAALEQYTKLIDTREDFLNGADGELDDSIIYRPTAQAILRDPTRFDTFKLLPGALQDNTEGVGLGHHIVIFALPETGKTLFAVNMAAGFLRQGLRVLYMGNEEPKEDVYLRFLTRLNEVPYSRSLFHDSAALEEAINLAKEQGHDNLVLCKLESGTKKEINRLANKFRPNVIVCDQILNLNISQGEKETDNLGAASKFMRELAGRHNAISISLTQAGDSATGKLYLNQGDIFMSNTKVPGDADLLVGLGVNHEFRDNDRIMVNLIKNKLNGTHTSFPVWIERSINKIRSK